MPLGACLSDADRVIVAPRGGLKELQQAMARLAALLLAATLLCGLAAAVAGQQRVLVLLDDPAMEQSHSSFLKGLSGRGYQLDIKPITDKSLQLKSWDEWLYDKAVILGSGKGERGGREGGSSAAGCLAAADASRTACCHRLPCAPCLPAANAEASRRSLAHHVDLLPSKHPVDNFPARRLPAFPARSAGRRCRRRAAGAVCGCRARPAAGG